MKHQEDIDQKIANVLSGAHTEQEKKEIEEWINQSEKNAFQYEQLKKFWQERTSDPKLIHHDTIKSKIWASVEHDYLEPPGSRQKFLTYHRVWKVAAVIILLVTSVFTFIYLNKPNESDGEIVTRDLIIKENPVGQKSQIQLPDGSNVWLNAESSISYYENFSGVNRTVNLDGEAYFEVKSDSLRPFIVQMDELNVSVLGTEFNVTAYEDDKDITVALVGGAVKVSKNNIHDPQDIFLSPGQGVNFSKEQQKYDHFSITEDKFLLKRVTSWKNGVLAFDGHDFDRFIKEISRWYGVKVKVIGNPPGDWHLRASFENEYLTNILGAISFNKDFTYQINNKELTMIFN